MPRRCLLCQRFRPLFCPFCYAPLGSKGTQFGELLLLHFGPCQSPIPSLQPPFQTSDFWDPMIVLMKFHCHGISRNKHRFSLNSPPPPEWPASRHRIASAFASWERIAEDFRSENAHRQHFCIASHRHFVFSMHRRSHRIAPRIARYGPSWGPIFFGLLLNTDN